MEKAKRKQGFASMSPEELRAISAKGGMSVPAEKRPFSQSRELASKAGKKGGDSVSPENRQYSRDRDLASRSGKAGAAARHSKPK